MVIFASGTLIVPTDPAGSGGLKFLCYVFSYSCGDQENRRWAC